MSAEDYTQNPAVLLDLYTQRLWAALGTTDETEMTLSLTRRSPPSTLFCIEAIVLILKNHGDQVFRCPGTNTDFIVRLNAIEGVVKIQWWGKSNRVCQLVITNINILT